jgi:hypothetical protein
MLKQTFDRMPQLMTGRRYATNVRFEDQLAEAMEQQMINQRLNDPKRRAYFDSLPEYIKRSNFNEDVGFEPRMDFGQPDYFDKQFEDYIYAGLPDQRKFQQMARELIKKNVDTPVTEREIATLIKNAPFTTGQISTIQEKFARLKQLEPEVNTFLLDLEEGMRGLSPSTPPASQAVSKSIGGLTEYYEDYMKDRLQEYYLLKGEIEEMVSEPLLDVRLTDKQYPELIQSPSYQRDKIQRMTGTIRPIQIEMQDYITVGDQEKQFFDTLSSPQMRRKDSESFYTAKVKEIEDKVNAMRQMERYNPNLPGVAPRGVDMSDAFANYAKARAEFALMFLPVVGGLSEGFTGAEEEQRIQGELDILREQMTDEERAEADKRLKEQEEQRPQYETNYKYR